MQNRNGVQKEVEIKEGGKGGERETQRHNLVNTEQTSLGRMWFVRAVAFTRKQKHTCSEINVLHRAKKNLCKKAIEFF